MDLLPLFGILLIFIFGNWFGFFLLNQIVGIILLMLAVFVGIIFLLELLNNNFTY